MRRSRQFLITTAAVVIMLAAAAGTRAFAYDFGLTIDNATGFTGDPAPAFTQRNKAAVWFSGEFGNLSLDAQGSYTFTLDRPYLFAVDVLDFGGEFLFEERTPLVLGFDAGRFVFSDFTGKLLEHTADGLRLAVNLPDGSFTVSAGFTGLLQVPNSSVIMSVSDAYDQSAPGVIFGAPRIFETAEITLPELFLRQTVTVQVLLQQDLRQSGGLASGGGLVHTQYFGAGFEGPVVTPLYYQAFFYLNTGQTEQGNILAFMTGGGLEFFLVNALSTRIGLDFIYASGDADYSALYEGNTSGTAAAFLPLSAYSPALYFTPRLTNVFFGRAVVSFKPLSNLESEAARNLSVELSAVPFFRSTPGPVSVSGVAAASSSLYLGTEADLVIRARPLSDLGLGLSFGLFFPGTAMTDPAVRMLGRLDVSISI